MTVLEHPASGARCGVPDGWGTTTDEGTGAALALEPEHDGFRASLVLTVEDTGASFREWQVGADALLPSVLHDYLLLDLERPHVAGRPGGRRLAHHVTEDGADVTLEQWMVLVDGKGFTLTATVDTLRYDALADELAACAATLVVP
ncbi:hypothetical protein EV189_2353 [Motilibacter rhizosphaerae]|uniref:Uncharacterized protein n=1 Tax=Motilibacter rhizosphaerae TaxID=598652 RepID=A0A4Q7NNW8_9ACTN|nr:hypothetical protein [Motilibacter rhizosphaerae]RZS86935.1 hypothetical protein EV189_2353 [Motilibacter rhizosphaerae]